MSNQLISLTTKQLRQAADLKEKIDALIRELHSLLGDSTPVSAVKAPKKGKMSAAGRAKIAAAQKARWAKPANHAVETPAKKSTMSAAGRARIAAAQKARWAKIKDEKEKAK